MVWNWSAPVPSGLFVIRGFTGLTPDPSGSRRPTEPDSTDYGGSARRCLGPLRLCPRSLGSGQCPKAGRDHYYMGKRWETIVANESGPKAGVEGVAEDVKGRAKEAVGAVTGNESVKQEGQAQQDKAAAQRDVAAKEAEAEKARAQASAAEAEQRSHQ
jgi:uncharacterized protein YjbJ (UPF0337 family)